MTVPTPCFLPPIAHPWPLVTPAEYAAGMYDRPPANDGSLINLPPRTRP